MIAESNPFTGGMTIKLDEEQVKAVLQVLENYGRGMMVEDIELMEQAEDIAQQMDREIHRGDWRCQRIT
jgi:hypothetical protein